MKTRRLAELSMLTAAALIIFIVELRFPDIIPVPGVKLGLANIVPVQRQGGIPHGADKGNNGSDLQHKFFGADIQLCRSDVLPRRNAAAEEDNTCEVHLALQYNRCNAP